MIKLQEIDIDLIVIENAPNNKLQQASLVETEGNIDPVKLGKNSNGTYWVVDGRRRITDLIQLGKKTVLAIVDDTVNKTGGHLQALILNSGRPNQMDESDHIQNLLDHGYDIKQISTMSNTQLQILYSRLRLQKLIPEFKTMLRSGKIKYSAAVIISKLSVKKQTELLNSGIKITNKNVNQFLGESQSQTIQNEIDLSGFQYSGNIIKISKADLATLKKGESITVGTYTIELE